MKWVTAIIKPPKLEAVRESLNDCGIQGLTVSEVRGFGRQKGHTEIYRGSEYTIDYVPKIRIDIAVDDNQLEATVEAVRSAAHSDKIGDGKIFVLELSNAMRIRTGETGPDAL